MKLALLEQSRLPVTSIRTMIDVLQEEGGDVDATLSEAGVTAAVLQDPEGMVTGIQELNAQRAFMRATTGRPDIWFRTGRRYRWLHYGMAGLAAVTAPNFQEMARTIQMWMPLTFSLSQLHYIMAEDLITGVEFDLSEVPENMRDFTVYRDLGAGVTFYNDIMGPESRLKEIFVGDDITPANLPADLSLGIPIRFGAQFSGYHWDTQKLTNTLRDSDIKLHEYYVRKCVEITERLTSDGGFLGAALTAVSRLDEKPAMDIVARKLNMSKRTLQRRLQDHGMTFHELRQSVLKQKAEKLLIETNLPVDEIAWRMGYADVSSFCHAFRRWNGMPPSDFRDRERRHPQSASA